MQYSTRRGFLRLTLGASWTGGALLEQSILRAAAARGQSRTAPGGLFTIQKMAEGVYGAIARPQTFVNCNAVIFENSSDILVVDTHSKPSAAASLLAQIRKEVSTKPVRYLVNSHFHWDHTQGTASYRKAFPKVDIIASETTRRLLSSGAAESLKSAMDNAAKSLDSARQKLSAAATEQEKLYWRRVVADTESFLQEMRNYTPDLPNITVSRDMILHDRAHELHVIFRGRGHTAGDVSVWCPAKKAIATGDLAHGSLPYMGDGYPTEWPNTLVSVGMLEFDKLLGGHSGVQDGKSRIFQMRDYIEELTVAVANGRRRGKPVQELQKEITPAKLKSLSGDYGDAQRAQLEAVRKLGMTPPGRTDEEILAGTVAGNVAQIFNAFDRRPEAG